MKRVLAATSAVLMLVCATAVAAQDRLVEQVVFNGNRRIPADTMRLWIQTREGDPFSRDVAARDLRTILAQGYFDDAKVFTEEGPRGGLVVMYEVSEYPTILAIDYPGLKSVGESDVLEELRKRSLSISKDGQLDPVRARRAAGVIRELLARKGRPDATVEVDEEELSATAVALHFRTDEGDRVRVAEIEFDGNTVFPDSELRSQMKLVKEAGLVSGLTSKDIYDKEKIVYDLQSVRELYWKHGYLNVKFGDPVVEEAGRVGSGVPVIGGKDRGLKVTVPVEEGRVYRVGKVTIHGGTVYTEEVVKAVVGLKQDEVADFSRVQKGVYEDLKKLYGERGYLNFEANAAPDFRDDPLDPTAGIVDFAIDLDEGKTFTIGRIEFKGNTFTRDKTIRREILLNEGDSYVQRYFDLSLLRINQLDFFQPVRDTDVDIRKNDRNGTVDLDYRLQEKGRQQIQVSAGGSGVGGSFAGLQYSTNNVLGYGESLSIDLRAGGRTKQFSFGFSEPYVLDRPVSAAFQLFYSTADYVNSASEDPDRVLFSSKTLGGSFGVSTPLTFLFPKSAKARFARVGLSYTYRTSSTEDPAGTFSMDPTGTLALSFAQPDVVQSTITPTFVYSTLDGGLDPTRGQSLTLGLSLSGGPLGGDVRTFQPTMEYRFYKPMRLIRDDDVFAVRFSAGHIRSFGSPFVTNSLSYVDGTPFLSRYFLGGQDTIRGYDAGEIAPVVPVEQFVTQSDVTAENPSGRTLTVLKPRDSNRRTIAPGAIRTFTFDDRAGGKGVTSIGGDTQMLMNVEYRVALLGPVSIAAFADVGSAFNARRLADQSTRTALDDIPLTNLVVVNPYGQLATPDEIRDATTPETPPGTVVPPGFRLARFVGDLDSRTDYRLSLAADGFRQNLRSTFGTEFRVQLPVVNVPVRVIVGYKQHEGKPFFEFAFGRTF